MSRPKETRYKERTRLIHGRFTTPKWDFTDHIVPPISSSAAYRLESAARGAEGFFEFANPLVDRKSQRPIYIYDRLDEPTRGMLEDNLAQAESAECAVCFSTGMGAISAILGVLTRSGDHVLSHHTIYGCTYSLLTEWYPRYNIGHTFADFVDSDSVKALIKPETRVLYFESPCNPTLELVDLRAIARIAAEENASRDESNRLYTVVDNTFASPFCQRPIEMGIDFVVHSLTKNIGGFGTDMGGVVIGRQMFENDLLMYRKDFGAALSPKAAWPTLVYGLPTLPVRTLQQQATALKVAQFLEQHPLVKKTLYPGLPSHPQHALAKTQMLDYDGNFAPGIMVYFILNGEPEDAKRMGRRLMDHLASNALSITLAVSLGQVRTLIEHPSSMTHAAIPLEEQVAAGLDPGGIRLSTGLEDPDDIIADLERGLKAAGK